jgi:Domain of unknown function (DUF222)
LRFNDLVRTMTLQLPPAEYAETKACIVAQAKTMPTDGETPWDQRCCDAFLGLLRSAGRLRPTGGGAGRAGARGRRGRDGRKGQPTGPHANQPNENGAGTGTGNGNVNVNETGTGNGTWNRNAGQGGPGASNEASGGEGVPPPPTPFLTVLHAPLSALFDEADRPTPLAGDLEHGGLISLETVRRLLCDSTFVIAIDDDDGHTMYEGRQRRSPTGAQRREIWRRDRCCRYPGCQHALFAEPHHLELWSKGGRTDLPNLALLCQHHHHLVHSNGWTVSGNANGVLTFVGPDGRTTLSRPSPMWTAINGPPNAS